MGNICNANNLKGECQIVMMLDSFGNDIFTGQNVIPVTGINMAKVKSGSLIMYVVDESGDSV